MTDDLTELSNADLLLKQDEIKSILAQRLNEDVISLIYSKLLSALKGRYSYARTGMMKNWEQLTPPNQKKFRKAWLSAVDKFVSRGILAKQRLYDLLIKLLTEHLNSYDSLSFNSIIEALDSIEELFDLSFPTYLTGGGIELLRVMLNHE